MSAANVAARRIGEKTRIVHALVRMRDSLLSVEKSLLFAGPIGPEAAQAIQQTANEIARHIDKHDAFDLAEQDCHLTESE